jgi:hypothetical protein
MPVLRMPTDTTLGDTLGNLGASLSQALNPMNMIRAQDIQAQVQQRQWEIQQQQRFDAANRNAAAVFRNANPLGQDDASKEATATQIEQGHYDPSQWVAATTGLAKQRAAQAAADTVSTDSEVRGYTPAEQASIKSLVLNGTSLADAKSQVATERLTSAKTGAALGAQGAVTSAVTPDMDPETKAVVSSLALTDPTAAESALNKQRTFVGAGNLPVGIAINDPRITQQNVRTEMGGMTPVPIAQAAGPQAVADITQKNIVARAAPQSPANVVPAVPPVDPLTGQPVTVAPGAALPSGVFSQSKQGPDTAAIADTAAADASSKAATEYAATQLQDGIAEGVASRKVLNDVAQLRRLGDLMDNDGMMTNAQNEIASRAYAALGLTLTPGQTAREVFDTYKAAIMANWRKDEGIQRLALPEIQLGQISLPSARMSHDALNQTLDQFQARAMLGDKVGQAALKYWGKGATAANASAFFDERNQIYDPKNNPTETIRKGRENAPPSNQNSPATVQQPDLKPGPNGGWVHRQPDGSYR